MSDNNEAQVAGRQAAVKAGGMRIKAARSHEEKPKTNDSTVSKDVYEEGKEIVITANNCYPRENSTEAVRATQNKPHPTHEKPVMNKQINKTIQQPR